MNPIRSLLGRRQFLFAFVVSTMALAFRRISKVFDLIFQTSMAKASGKPVTAEGNHLKGIVVYYSATASTAKIANAIYQGMKSVIDCDVAPVKKIDPKKMKKYDVIAIGAPIWLHREPANIKVFTNSMPGMDGKSCILFCTHGTQPFSIFWTMSRNLLKKGMTIIGWNDWYGDAIHVLHQKLPYITHGHPDEIDLKEAKAFGREMAERAQRIAAGEKDLIPEIPTPVAGVSSLWSPHLSEGHIMYGGLPPSRPGSPDPNEVPKFDLKKCVYPRCTQCIDNCPVNAIDLSVITPSNLSDSPLVVKEACAHCGGLCQRVCFYDAISYIGEKTLHAIDMTKCIYPKCTLCVDECLMDAIDFTQNPPVVHERCEGCDLCWCICPVDGASVITNMEKSQYLHVPTSDLPEEIVKKYNLQDPPGGGMPMPMMREGGEGAGGPMPMMGEEGEDGQRPRSRAQMMPKFRQLISDEEVGKDGLVMLNPNVPRIVLNKEDWPYKIDEG